MAALILPSRRVVQPQGPVEIDRGSPLTAGIQFAYIPAFSRFSSVNNAGFQGGSAVFGAATTGQGIAYPTPPVFLGSLSQSTILGVGSTRAVTGAEVGQISSGGDAIFSERGSSGSDIYKIGLVAVDTLSAEFVYRNDAGNLLQQRVKCVGLNDGRKIAISATKNGTTHRVGINGVFSSGTIGNASTAFTNATLTRQIGADLGDTAAAWNGYVDVVAGWDRALSVAEINALTDNPWQIFRPIQRRIWVPVAGGGPVTHAATGALVGAGSTVAGAASRTRVFSSAGVLQGAGALLSGSADRTGAPTVHDASGALLAAGSALSGAAQRLALHGSSGVLAGDGAALSGNASRVAAAVAHTASGALVGPGAQVNGAGQVGEIVVANGFVFTDTPSALWWKRKPKALSEEIAEQKVKRVVRVIKQIAAKQAPEQSAKQAKREVAQAIAPLIAEMPGFDWTPIYRNIVADFERQREEAARIEAVAQIARIRAIEQDDEDVLILLMI